MRNPTSKTPLSSKHHRSLFSPLCILIVASSCVQCCGFSPVLAPAGRVATLAQKRGATFRVSRSDGGEDFDFEGTAATSSSPADLLRRSLTGLALAAAVFTTTLAPGGSVDFGAGVARADTWGKETEAPTLFTGETVMICKKRGPLGACIEQTVRTAKNDNDKALEYFQDPSEAVKRKNERMVESASVESEGNALIDKLRKQSVENKEKNDRTVRTKTMINNQAASFGPFDSQVVILNTNGDSFTLLQNPQAMRLKKAGYIEGRKFVIQPSQEVIDDALASTTDLGETIKGFFGSGGGGDKEEVVDKGKEQTNDIDKGGVANKEEVSVSDVDE